jgi:hypothetical protein
VEFVELRVPFYNSKINLILYLKLKEKFYLPVLSESLDLNPNLILIIHDVRRLQKLYNTVHFVGPIIRAASVYFSHLPKNN